MSEWGLAQSALLTWVDPGVMSRLPADRTVPVPGPLGPVVRLDGVTKRFGGQAALAGISLDIRQGEILGVIGRSGAGKSTLIRCLNGLEHPDEGRVEVLGRDLRGLDAADLRRLRGRIGMIFQHFNLLSAKTVEGNVALPLKIAGADGERRRARVAELLALVGLDGKARAYPAQLSGGQKQRVGIARALAADPALLLSDEATSALDPETTQSILALLRDINARFGLTIVMITHEMSVVRAVADRVVVLDAGRVAEEGPAKTVFTAPRSAAARRMLAADHSAWGAALAEGLDARWRPGLYAMVKLVAAGPAARDPVVAELASGGLFRPLVIEARVERIGDEPAATTLLAFPDTGPDAVQTLRRLLSEKVSSFELLGYAQHPF